METLNVLFVDDDEEYRGYLTHLLERDVSELTGGAARQIRVRYVSNQEDADQALDDAPERGYDMILLDLLYYDDRAQEAQYKAKRQFLRFAGDWTELQGMRWLPQLRKRQPYALIIIMTAYALEGHLQNVVTAMLDYQVAEFIPKEAPWDEIKQRIAKASDRPQLLNALSAEFQASRRLRSALTSGEDAAALLSQARIRLYQIADRIEAGDASEIAAAPAKLRREIDDLARQLPSLLELPGAASASAEKCDVADLVRRVVVLSRDQARRAQATVNVEPRLAPVPVTTFLENLRTAFLEVVHNGLDALEYSSVPPPDRRLDITVAREPDCVKVSITDNGGGFSDRALAHLFKRGFSDNRGPSEKGVGLYVARNMMHSIGGDIAVENSPTDAPPQGAKIVLTIPDLG